LNRIIRNLERELDDHQTRIRRQELKIETEQRKLDVLREFQERWGAQLQKLREAEEAKQKGAQG
jgi:hypothetical protein